MLSVAPCCGGPARRKLCRRFSTLTGTSPEPVVLCGIPSHAKIGVATNAILRLTRRDGVVTVGRTGNDLTSIVAVLHSYPSSFSVLDNSSKVAVDVLSYNNRNTVSILTGTLPGCVSALVRDTVDRRIETTRLGLAVSPLCSLLFISNGPTNIGTVVDNVNMIDGDLQLPLMPTERSAVAEVVTIIGALPRSYLWRCTTNRDAALHDNVLTRRVLPKPLHAN